MSAVFCPNCRNEIEPRIEQRPEVFTIKGDPTEVESRIGICSKCGHELFLEELEEGNFKRAYDAYRRKHEMLTASEIRDIRENYGLSQRALAQLLGMGEVTVSRYENGAIQTRGHDHLLKLLREPENVRTLLDETESNLPSPVREQLATRLDELLGKSRQHSLGRCLAELLSSGEPTEANGYRRFDLERTHQVTCYLASYVKGFFQSKATKLLWYVDFLAFKSQARSITGCEYLAAKFGPVPKDYSLLFAEMVASRVLSSEEIFFDSDEESDVGGEIYRPLRDPQLDTLSPLEKRCVEAVAVEFRDLTAGQTIRRAHQEKAYLQVFEEGASWQTIPYRLAETLSLPSL